MHMQFHHHVAVPGVSLLRRLVARAMFSCSWVAHGRRACCICAVSHNSHGAKDVNAIDRVCPASGWLLTSQTMCREQEVRRHLLLPAGARLFASPLPFDHVVCFVSPRACVECVTHTPRSLHALMADLLMTDLQDFTFVCPTEITAFSDRHADFKELNCEVRRTPACLMTCASCDHDVRGACVL